MSDDPYLQMPVGVQSLLSRAEFEALPDLNGLPSVYFDPHWRLQNVEAVEAVKAIQLEVNERRLRGRTRMPGKKKQKQFDDCVACILTVLLRAFVKSEKHTAALPKSKQRLNDEKRYRPEFATVHFMREAIDLLLELGILEIKQAGYNFPGFGEITRYALSKTAMDRTNAKQLRRGDFTQLRPSDVILLRGMKDKYTHSAPLIDYTDDDFTRGARSRLKSFNDLLERTELELACVLDRSIVSDAEIDPERRYLYRVFNNCTFEDGGRFYGGWWQHIPSALRRHITINGCRTIEADYSGLHPAILFAQAGMEIPSDPYARVPGASESRILRKHAKRTFNALLNASSLLVSEPRNFDTAKHGRSAEAFRLQVIDAFPEFKHLFGTGAGVRA